MVACAATAAGCNRILGIEQKEPSDAALVEPGFKLSIAQTRVRVVRGQSAKVDVTVQRVGGFGGEVAIQAVPPSGVTVDPVTFAPSETAATLVVRASSSAPVGQGTLVVFAGSYGIGVSNEQLTLSLVIQDPSGSEDYTFGAPSFSGRVPLSLGTGGQGVGAGGLAVAPSGAIVICGHARTDQAQSSVALAQLAADGTLDKSFGASGIVLGNSAMSSADSCNAMFVRAGGGATLAGFGTPTAAGTKSLMIARYRPGGLADQNTGDAGGPYVTTPIDSPADSIAYGLLPVANAFFLASGVAARGAVVVRYGQHGEYDPTYGSNGVATVGPEQSSALWLAGQSSGDVLVAVTSTTFRIVRLAPGGTIDTSFANNGVATAGDVAGSAAVVLVDPSDRVLAAGTVTGPTGSQDTAVVRLTESGEVDPTYGSGGWAVASFGGDSSVSGAVLQDDGAVVVVGQTPGQGFSAVRFSAAGALDTAFGTGGRAPLEVNGSAQAVALDDLGRILVAGIAGADDASDGVVVYRLWP